MIQKKIAEYIKFYQGIGIGLILAVGFSVLAFTEPTLAPPGGNVGAPINVSGTAQTKTGKLNIGGGLSYWITKVGDSFALENNAGQTNFILGQDGRVGIRGEPEPIDFHIYGKWDSTGKSSGTGIELDSGPVGGKGWRIVSTGRDASQGPEKLVFHDDSSGYTALTIQGAGAGAGHVGIGTTNPTGRLDIIASYDWPTPTLAVRGNIAHPNIQLKSDNGGRDWRFISCGSGCGPTGALRFFDNSGGGDRMVIMPDGNIGINTTAPGYKLTVGGDIYSSNYVRGEQGLCIGGDCKSSWSQVGGGGTVFGGMYTLLSVNGGTPFCSISNAVTGGCSCPAGAPNSSFVHRSYGPCSEWTCSGGTRYVWDLYMCWK